MAGLKVFSPAAQSISLLSRRGVPKTFFARIDTDGLLPDAMRLRGSAGNRLFAVGYFSGGSNVTARMIAGTFVTAVMGPDDEPVAFSVTVTPNKRLIIRKVKKGKRVLTTYPRKTHSGLIEATATGDSTRTDRVR